MGFARGSKLTARLLKAGGLAQLARALALQAKGHRFESDILHKRFEICDCRFQI